MTKLGTVSAVISVVIVIYFIIISSGSNSSCGLISHLSTQTERELSVRLALLLRRADSVHEAMMDTVDCCVSRQARQRQQQQTARVVDPVWSYTIRCHYINVRRNADQQMRTDETGTEI